MSELKPTTSFSRDVLKLMSGTVAAQLLMVLASPVLTRLFGPEVFGEFSVFSAIVIVLTGILCLKYEEAIMLPASDTDALHLLIGNLVISVSISILTIPAVFLFGDALSTLLNAPDLKLLLWFIPALLLFGGLGNGHPALNYWLARTKRYKELSIARVIGALTTTVFQLGLGIIGFTSSLGLVIGTAAGSVVSPLFLARQIWIKDIRAFLPSIQIRTIFNVLSRYKNFPLYNIWSVLLNTISWQIPIFLLSYFFSTTISGFYALGFRLFQVPMSLIGSSYAQVFYKQISDAKQEGKLTDVVKKTFGNLVDLGLFPFLILTIIGREVFALIFGPQWSEAGVYAQILGVWAFVWFISSPLSNLYNLLEKQKLLLGVNIMILASRLLSLLVGGWIGNPRLAITLFSLTGIVVYWYLNVLLFKLSGVELSYVYRTLASALVKFMPSGLILFGLLFVRLPLWVYTCVGILLIGMYYVDLVRRNKELRQLLSELLSKKTASS
jgi:lipopolysaccharide exporter